MVQRCRRRCVLCALDGGCERFVCLGAAMEHRRNGVWFVFDSQLTAACRAACRANYRGYGEGA